MIDMYILKFYCCNYLHNRRKKVVDLLFYVPPIVCRVLCLSLRLVYITLCPF